MSGLIQITQTAVHADPGSVKALAREFADTGCAPLSGFLAPTLLNLLRDSIETSQFVVKSEEEAGHVFGTTMFVPVSEPSLFLLHFMLNRQALFQAVREIADCAVLTGFIGRLHRTSAGSGHSIGWHDDAVHLRTVGMSINLGTGDYSGGTFELRGPDGTIRGAIKKWSPGDAFLFRIGAGWEHRLTPVGAGSRTAGVGWFRTGEAWHELVLSEARARLIQTAERINRRV